MEIDNKKFSISLVVALAGFVLCVISYYPGYAMIDSVSIYKGIQSNDINDWFPPCFSLLWKGLDALWPGQQTLFLLQNALYWAAVFFIGSIVTATRGVTAACVAMGFCFTPYFLLGLGVVQREPLMASAMLLAFSLMCFHKITGHMHPMWVKSIAILLCVCAVSIRHEAIVMLPFFAAYLAVQKWDFRKWITLKKTGLMFVWLSAMYIALTQICYMCTDAKISYPSGTLIYFDLKGISYFMGEGEYENFGEFDSVQAKQQYDGREWSRHYLTQDQRDMDYFHVIHNRHWSDLQGVRLLWLRMVLEHPLAYLKHRLNHYMYQLELKDPHVTVLKIAIEYKNDPEVLQQNYKDLSHATMTRLAEAMYQYGIFRVWVFFALSILLVFFYRRFESSLERELYLVLLLGAIAYSLIFLFIGVAHQARYLFWHNMATVVALGLLCAQCMPKAAKRPKSAKGPKKRVRK